MAKAKLLPCPFCGGDPAANVYSVSAAVRCVKCGVLMRYWTINGRTPEATEAKALEAWNRRTNDKAPSAKSTRRARPSARA